MCHPGRDPGSRSGKICMIILRGSWIPHQVRDDSSKNIQPESSAPLPVKINSFDCEGRAPKPLREMVYPFRRIGRVDTYTTFFLQA